MPGKPSRLRRATVTTMIAALLPLILFALSACGTPTEVPKPAVVPTTAAQLPDTPAPAPPAPVATSAVTGDSGNSGGMAAPPADISNWTLVTHNSGGTTFSYRYPAGWTPDLSYCAPGAARSGSASQLPARCASTDILVGQKARDLGTLNGQNITIGGKQAIKQIDRAPRNGQAEVIYTVLVYDPRGTPLAGFSTSIGPGTDTATANNILSVLDQIAATFTVN